MPENFYNLIKAQAPTLDPPRLKPIPEDAARCSVPFPASLWEGPRDARGAGGVAGGGVGAGGGVAAQVTCRPLPGDTARCAGPSPAPLRCAVGRAAG